MITISNISIIIHIQSREKDYKWILKVTNSEIFAISFSQMLLEAISKETDVTKMYSAKKFICLLHKLSKMNGKDF